MGRKEPSVTVVQPPPPQITQPVTAPNVQQNAGDLFQAQLTYNPQLTQQAAQLQQQYGPPLAQSQVDIQRQLAPQLAQSEYDIQRQYGPLYRALFTQLFPTQVAGQEALSQQALGQIQSPTGLTTGQQTAQDQALQAGRQRAISPYGSTIGQQSLQQYQSPTGLTPSQLTAQEAIRQRARDQIARSVRESANLGGTLYGGRRQEREDRSLNELEQGFVTEDIGLQERQRQQAFQNLMAANIAAQQESALGQQFGLQDVGLQQQARQASLQNLIAGSQVVFPQVQQPGVPQATAPQFGQGVIPSPDALLAAIMNNYLATPSVVGFGPSSRQQNTALLGALGQAGGAFARPFAMGGF